METEAGVFFLRVYEQVQSDDARAELALVEHLRGRGVPTPAVVPLASGEALSTLAGKPAALFVFAKGRDLCQRQVTTSHARAVGCALAQLHVATQDYPGCTEDRFSFAQIVRRVDELASAEDAQVRTVLPILREEIDWLSGQSETQPVGVIHGDLFRDNVLFEGEEITALLDFESAAKGALAYDLAVCLLSWTFDQDFRADLGQALVSGYASVRELAPAERDPGLYVEARRAALRFTVTRILDFHLRHASGARREKDFRRYLLRMERLRALGREAFASLIG